MELIVSGAFLFIQRFRNNILRAEKQKLMLEKTIRKNQVYIYCMKLSAIATLAVSHLD